MRGSYLQSRQSTPAQSWFSTCTSPILSLRPARWVQGLRWFVCYPASASPSLTLGSPERLALSRDSKNVCESECEYESEQAKGGTLSQRRCESRGKPWRPLGRAPTRDRQGHGGCGSRTTCWASAAGPESRCPTVAVRLLIPLLSLRLPFFSETDTRSLRGDL